MVKIIPKPASKTPLWQQIMLSLSVVIIISTIVGYFVLDYFQKEKMREAKAIEDEISLIELSEGVELKNELFGKQNKINDFKVLLEDHADYSDLFPFLASICHPRVQFDGLEFSRKNSEYEVSLKSEAESYEALHQQILILKEEERIKKAEVSGISISKEGTVSFSLNLSLNPNLFKFE
jgi:hypothetical protein